MIPTPPNHWIIARQRFSPWGKYSKPVKTVEPVVVSPDIASNTASTIRASVAPNTKGSAAKIGKIAQIAVVRRKVCCRLRPCCTPLAQENTKARPINTEIAADSAKTPHSPLAKARSTPIGTSIDTPRKVTIRPMTYPTGRISNMTQSVGP